MFQGSTDFLSYLLVLFVGWIYLPNALFRFSAEFSIDLGRRGDSTQLEEIVSAFLPGIILNIQTAIFYYLFVVLLADWFGWIARENFQLKLDVLASMFGQNRGAVSDYIYAGNWKGCVTYILLLWVAAIANGSIFGWQALKVSERPDALQGFDTADAALRKESSLWLLLNSLWNRDWLNAKNRSALLRRTLLWRFWHPFFKESLVPLFTWRQKHPIVRVSTKKGQVFVGTFLGYEKTSEGEFAAIRLGSVTRQTGLNQPALNPTHPDDTTYLNWSRISDISIE